MSTTTHPTILLADEDDVTRAFLADNLTADGYRVLIAPDRAKALALLCTGQPDLIVVDINGQTLELLDAVRCGEGIAGRTDPDVPVIVMSRSADRLQRIRMLERGGDDFVKKPFSYAELRARIGAVLRRSQTTRRGARIVRAGPVVIDVRSREVRVCDRPVELSGTEYRLLVALAGEPHRVFTREELLRGVWGFETFGRTRTLDSHAFRLRRKLCDGGERAAGGQRVGRRLPAVRSAGRRCLLTSPRRRASKASTSSWQRSGRLAPGRRWRARPRSSGYSHRARRRSRRPPARCCTPRPRSSRSTGRCPDCSPSRPGRCSPSPPGLRKPPTSRARGHRTDARSNHDETTRGRELPRRRRRPARARRARDRRRRLAGARHRPRRGQGDRHAGRRPGRPPAGRGDRPRLPEHRRASQAGTCAARSHT